MSLQRKEKFLDARDLGIKKFAELFAVCTEFHPSMAY